MSGVFEVRRVEAIGTIYIRADGSIDPPTAPIATVDNVTYTFTGNVNDSIVVERDSIMVDGQGYTVQGTGSRTGITLSERSNVTIKNTEITTFYNGIRLDSSSNYNSISGNNIANNGYGIWLEFSSGNTLFGNNVTANNDDGIELLDSSNNVLSGNNVTANNDDGIRLIGSSGNTLFGNNVTANNDDGIGLADSSNNVLSGNNVTANNDDGIVLSYSSDNTLSGNNLANNGYGVYLYYSSDNVFYHNNFVANTQQVNSTSSTNVWDDDYPSGGNYWSDYTGADANHDGTGDTPYIIDADNADNYPLMVPYVIPEFPSFLILPLFMIATLLAVIFYKRQHPPN